jgi:hypothetical protein
LELISWVVVAFQAVKLIEEGQAHVPVPEKTLKLETQFCGNDVGQELKDPYIVPLILAKILLYKFTPFN